jgi:hypothetical protein
VSLSGLLKQELENFSSMRVLRRVCPAHVIN